MTITAFQILVVCTGNICRSPMGERLLRAALDDSLEPSAAGRFAVTSAGTWPGHAGEPMQPGARRTLAARGIAEGGFVASAVTADRVSAADLILVAQDTHTRAVRRLAPEASALVIPVLAFGRLIASESSVASRLDGVADPVERARVLVEVTRERVAQVREQDGLGDPYAQPDEAFADVADLLTASFRAWVRLLTREASDA